MEHGQDLALVVVKVIQGSENRCLDDMANITAHFTDRLVSTFTKGWGKFHFQIRGKHFQTPFRNHYVSQKNAYHALNRERTNASSRAWKLRHAKHVLQNARKYHAKNRQKQCSEMRYHLTAANLPYFLE